MHPADFTFFSIQSDACENSSTVELITPKSAAVFCLLVYSLWHDWVLSQSVYEIHIKTALIFLKQYTAFLPLHVKIDKGILRGQTWRREALGQKSAHPHSAEQVFAQV